jgi:hypothetical protein
MARSSVVTKSRARATFGNDNVGFIRVRRRTLTPYWEDGATVSASYDLVRAVRVDGKPRHKFVLGLGSQKDVERSGHVGHFWDRAVGRMIRHGLTEARRRYFLTEMVRKGATLPSRKQYAQFLEVWPDRPDIREIEGLIPSRRKGRLGPWEASSSYAKCRSGGRRTARRTPSCARAST